MLNANLNTIAKRFREKGITLYFMPAADKYTMYSRYILNNPYPESVFFELLRKEPRDYVLVDTKNLLNELIEKGEQDVYYSDDTHWSWKASRKIAESMRFNSFPVHRWRVLMHGDREGACSGLVNMSMINSRKWFIAVLCASCGIDRRHRCRELRRRSVRHPEERLYPAIPGAELQLYQDKIPSERQRTF
jgi:hypothetical protein